MSKNIFSLVFVGFMVFLLFFLATSTKAIENRCNAGFTPSVNGDGNICICAPSGSPGTCGNNQNRCNPGYKPSDATSRTCTCQALADIGTTGGTCSTTGNYSSDGPGAVQRCGNGIVTALGCIPVGSTQDFVAWFLEWIIGIAGGIGFLFIIFASFQIMTAQGDPQKLNGGRELLTAAVSGLILVVFSVFILKVIGVDVLHLNSIGF